MSTNAPVAFVTGTSTGFGHLIARDLATAGYQVFATMRDTATRNAGPKQALEAAGIVVLDVDVTSDASVEAAAAAVHARVSAVDLVVNNAGSAFMGLTEAFTAAEAAAQYDTNVLSTIRVNRAFLPGMRAAKRGLIVYISSVVGRMIIPFTGVYAASKWAMEAIAEASSYELRPFGIDIALVEPGAYGTNIFNAIVVPKDAKRVEQYGDVAKIFDQISAGMGSSAGDPQEVADAVVRLAKLPAGERPLRTVVGGNSEPIVAINDAAAPYQRGVLEAYGLGDLLPKQNARV